MVISEIVDINIEFLCFIELYVFGIGRWLNEL
jgi:hypothetical protein